MLTHPGMSLSFLKTQNLVCFVVCSVLRARGLFVSTFEWLGRMRSQGTVPIIAYQESIIGRMKRE